MPDYLSVAYASGSFLWTHLRLEPLDTTPKHSSQQFSRPSFSCAKGSPYAAWLLGDKQQDLKYTKHPSLNHRRAAHASSAALWSSPRALAESSRWSRASSEHAQCSTGTVPQ